MCDKKVQTNCNSGSISINKRDNGSRYEYVLNYDNNRQAENVSFNQPISTKYLKSPTPPPTLTVNDLIMRDGQQNIRYPSPKPQFNQNQNFYFPPSPPSPTPIEDKILSLPGNALDLQKRQINQNHFQLPQEEFRNVAYSDRQATTSAPSKVNEIASDVLSLFGYHQTPNSFSGQTLSTDSGPRFNIQPTIHEEQNQGSSSFSSIELSSHFNNKIKDPIPQPFREQNSGSSSFYKPRTPTPDLRRRPKPAPKSPASSSSSSSKSSKSSKHSHGDYEVYEAVVYNVAPNYNNYSSNFCQQPANYYPQHLSTPYGQGHQMGYQPQQQMGFFPQQMQTNYFQPPMHMPQMQMGCYQQPMNMNYCHQQFFRPNYC